MNRTKLMASASLAAAMLYASPAVAAGTASGTTITNNVSVAFQVGGVSQTAATASNSFTVDRKVNLVVAEVGSVTTQVSPGETNAVTAFDVTNSSNAPLDLALAATQLSGGTSAHGGTDNFNVTIVNIFVDTNTNGVYNVGVDQAITYLDQVAADATQRVFVVANVPLGRATNDVAGVRLTATASEATAAGSLGATVTETAGANTAGVDTVFADTNADGNTARNGIHFDEDDYTVLAAALSATKTSTVIDDPLNGTTNPKMIPGATVEYCIAVSNGGGATATNVAITDTLPATTTFVVGSIRVNGTTTLGVCNADGVAGGSFAAGTVSAGLPNIASGETRTVYFRVTVN
jgi:uncharacterized repeat protein (TIGR01451 family)